MAVPTYRSAEILMGRRIFERHSFRWICYRHYTDISETNTSGESAGNSATVSLLRSLIEIIRKSDKTSGHIITEQERNSKFPLTDLITIRKFTQIAGIKIDERKFRNRREFQMYFRELMKEDNRKEDWR